jgi:hypothetical protein
VGVATTFGATATARAVHVGVLNGVIGGVALVQVEVAPDVTVAGST